MKHIKLFESFKESELPVSSKYDVKRLVYELIMYFDNEEDWEEWCCEQSAVTDYDDVDFDGIASYDVPKLLGLPVNNDEVTELVGGILSELEFDDEIRDADYENWLLKIAARKYNI